jgi:hypothetical protein
MVLGLVCRVRSGQPLVVGVHVEMMNGALVASKVLEHRPVKHAQWADQLKLMAGELETLLKNDPYAAVVVKTIEDRTPMGAPKLTDANRKRLQLEGVLLAVSRQHTEVVVAMTGQEIGALRGSNKATVEGEAAVLMTGREEVIEATAAALAAWTLANRPSS